MMNIFKKHLVIGGFALFCSIIASSSVVYAVGIEPGAGCPTELDLVFAPPPFMGTLTAEWNGGEVVFHTDSEAIGQVGNNDCALRIDAGSPVLFSAGVDLALEFQPTTAQDLQGICLADLAAFFTAENGDACIENQDAFFEIVGAHQVRFAPDGLSFEADVIIMQVEPK